MKDKFFKKMIGNKGEDIACDFLKNKGYKIKIRNYRKKWGEIDIIAEKERIIHFVEVKTVSCETLNETGIQNNDKYRPEDNIHPWKLKRLSKTIQSYLKEKEIEWRFDIITIHLDLKNKKAKVNFLKDIII